MKQNSDKKPLHLQNGVKGETITCGFITKRGFRVIERNYRRKWGEIDIIAIKEGIIHFIEVKTVSRESNHRPEENIHPLKLKRLKRAMQTYVSEKGLRLDTILWQFDAAIVFLDREKGREVSFMENLII